MELLLNKFFCYWEKLVYWIGNFGSKGVLLLINFVYVKEILLVIIFSEKLLVVMWCMVINNIYCFVVWFFIVFDFRFGSCNKCVLIIGLVVKLNGLLVFVLIWFWIVLDNVGFFR